jgi:hypothetical protein
MTVKIKKGKKISEKDLIAFEQRAGVKFPTDYRNFLIENNGGIPEANEFDVPGTNNGSGINEFLSIDDLEVTKKRLGNRLLPSAWAIAYAEGGNYLCLVIGEKKGVYFWDHELETEEELPASWDNMFLVSENFADFLSSLKKFDINEIELKPGQVQDIWVDPDFKPEF